MRSMPGRGYKQLTCGVTKSTRASLFDLSAFCVSVVVLFLAIVHHRGQQLHREKILFVQSLLKPLNAPLLVQI